MLSWILSSLTVQGLDVDGLELALDDGSCTTSVPSELAHQVDHVLDDEGMILMVLLGELEGAFSTGGVILRGGGAKYDIFCISQNENHSGPSSITLFNLMPNLKATNL
jgi:hypothetical protein